MFRSGFVIVLMSAVLLPSCSEKERVQKGEIVVEAERVTASKADTPRDIQPYDEALSWHEYKIKRVLAGELAAPIIRVAHWTVVAAKAVPVSDKKGEKVKLKIVPFESVAGLASVKARNDLDKEFSVAEVEKPRFLDLSQTLAQPIAPSAFRCDYRGTVSEQMRLYWKLRPQLRGVVMGNSHATKGVNPRAIMDNDNWVHPSMLNMAPAGANNDQQCLMLRDYALSLPKLEWLLWVVSARTFNAERLDDTRKYEEFVASPGRQYDVQHRSEFWPVPAAGKRINTDELKQFMGPMGLDVWGSLIIAKTLLPEDPAEHRNLVMRKCTNVEFRWSDEIFAKFCDTARAFSDKGVKVLLFTTPMHPLTKETPAVDPDGTSLEGFREMVRQMEEFDKKMPGLWFRDFHKDGAHEFPASEFYDVDHLNRAGTGRLGTMIKEWMAQCETEHAAHEANHE